MLPAGLLIGRYAYRSIISFPKSLLVPTIAFLTVVGSFAIHSNAHDVQLMFVLGVIAWVLNRYGFQPSPIVLGLVLGQIAEQGFVQTWLIGNATGNLAGMYFGRPISIGIIAAAALTLCYPFYAEWRARKNRTAPLTEIAADAEAHPVAIADTGAAAATAAPARQRDIGALTMGAIFIVIGIAALMDTADMSPMGSVFPRAISTLLIVFSAVMVALALLGGGVRSPAPEPSEAARRRIWLGVIFGVWVFAIPVIGFATSGLIAFIAMMFVAEHEPQPAAVWLRRALIGLAVVAAFWLIMSQVLLLRMPAAWLF